MVKSEFKRIADKENGAFYYEDATGLSGNGIAYPYVLFLIQIIYKNHKIIIDNRTGSSFVGTAILKLNATVKAVDFKITSISHLTNFFLRKKSRFKIISTNQNIKYFLKNNIALKKLRDIAKKHAFSPEMVTNLNKKPNTIITKYHLEFNNWTQVIEPLIEFYKNIADEFDKNLLFLNTKQYQDLD